MTFEFVTNADIDKIKGSLHPNVQDESECSIMISVPVDLLL